MVQEALIRRSGGTGRRAGFKIQFWQQSKGSIPFFGTNSLTFKSGYLILFRMYFHVYILYSLANDRFYIGQTNDLDKRIERHNKGSVKSTKAYRPWKIVYCESFETRAESMKREGHLKSLKSILARISF